MWWLYKMAIAFVSFLAAILCAIFMYIRFSQNRYLTGKEIPAEKKAQVKQRYILTPLFLLGYAIFMAFFWQTPVTRESSNNPARITEEPTEPEIIEFHRSDAATPKISVRTFTSSFQRVARSFGGQFGDSSQWTAVNDRNLQLIISRSTVVLLTFGNEGGSHVTGATIIYENGQDETVLKDVHIALCSLIAFFEPDITYEFTPLMASGLTEKKGDARMIMATGNTYFLMREGDVTQIVVLLNFES